MARKSFALQTEPHVAEIGDDIELEFLPEVMGDDYLDALGRLQDRYKNLGIDLSGDIDEAPPEALREVNAALREFIGSLMLPESAERFSTMRLPDRVVVALLEWSKEIYGGGRPPTSSNGSAAASPPRGTRSTGSSRSKGSTPTRGR
ncbi:hypothetical protein [Streptomyces atratus]|uniref:hypothetical protein n=1 Tax=Streptomyces atratus TaxID=1893 RepID=UPI002F90B076